ncbi:MAG: multiheme c-type cytochrome [Thiogranum sp.]|nr:multiheme c-type cytochrome [Thiogranum sp.]
MSRLGTILLMLCSITATAGTRVQGEFENSACLACHDEQDSELVAAWRDSAHGSVETTATCVSCHGNDHAEVASRARRDASCIACHGGPRGPVVHSYTTSKHGVLVRLEPGDRKQPLSSANYRAPGCAYCHMHSGNHDVATVIRSWQPEQAVAVDERERVQDAQRSVCQDCHAPRYITNLFDNGERMLEIGHMKVREAAALMKQARADHEAAALQDAEQHFLRMKQQHMKNLYLGVAHQSPDYQWWHGQPSLDGDLIRIRGAIGLLRRLKALESVEKNSGPASEQRTQ